MENTEKQPPFTKNYGCKFQGSSGEICALAGCQARVAIIEILTEFEGNKKARLKKVSEIEERARRLGCPSMRGSDSFLDKLKKL